MTDPRLREILAMLDPKPGVRLWHGGASPLGSLRGVPPEQARWKPTPDRHSIWEFALHIAYWDYAVRRVLQDGPIGGFPRSPANWPAVPARADAGAWATDRALLRTEQQKLIAAVRAFDPARLDEVAPGKKAYRFADLLHGIVMHDTYHAGQIQLMKRLYRARGKRGR